MTAPLQITFDCVDSHAQARFWASTLGYEIEDHHDLVQQMLDTGQATRDDVIERDGRLSWREAAACRAADGTRLLFMVVPEPKTAKNRMHLDVNCGGGRGTDPEIRRARVDAEVDRLVALGATKVNVGGEFGGYHVVMQDPEGNEFCLQ